MTEALRNEGYCPFEDCNSDARTQNYNNNTRSDDEYSLEFICNECGRTYTEVGDVEIKFNYYATEYDLSAPRKDKPKGKHKKRVLSSCESNVYLVV